MKKKLIFLLLVFFPFCAYTQIESSYFRDQINLRYLNDSLKSGSRRYVDEQHNTLHGCYSIQALWDVGIFGSGVSVTGVLSPSYVDTGCFDLGVPYGKWVYNKPWGRNCYTIVTENIENGYLNGVFKVETTNGDNLSYQTTFDQGTGYYINMSPYIIYAQGKLNKGEKNGLWIEIPMHDLVIRNIEIEKYDNGKFVNRKVFYPEKSGNRASKKVDFVTNRTYENETTYHMEFYVDSLPRLQGMIYEGKKVGWWIYTDRDFSNITKIVCQLYENNKPVKKRRLLYMQKDND